MKLDKEVGWYTGTQVIQYKTKKKKLVERYTGRQMNRYVDEQVDKQEGKYFGHVDR